MSADTPSLPYIDRHRWPVTVIAALAGMLAGAAVTPWPQTLLAAFTGALLGTAAVSTREWILLRRLPAPLDSPVHRAPVPGPPEDVLDVHETSIVTRPLAVTRLGVEAVESLRRLRLELRESTGEDAHQHGLRRAHDESVDPVHHELAGRRSLQRRLEVAPLVAIAWILLLIGLHAHASWPLLALAPLAAVAIRILMPRLRTPVPPSRVDPASPAGYSPFTELGCIGGNLAASSTFGGTEVFGIAGERRTAELLETWLGGISRVAILHSLRFPGSARADIDHVVLIGHRLFVIDSKAWKGGTYRQISADTVLAPDGSARSSAMPVAAAALTSTGWGHVQVLTVVHATSGTVEVQGAGDAAHMVLAPVDLIRVLMEARRQVGRRAWSPEDAETFAARVGVLQRMLVDAPEAHDVPASSRAA